MRKYLSAVVAAIEAAAIALAGIVIIAVPAILIWIVTFSLSAEPRFVAQIISVVWLTAHGAHAAIVLAPEAAVGIGMPPEEISFDFGLIPLGLTAVTVVLAVRLGLRARGSLADGAVTIAGATLGFVGATVCLSWLAGDLIAMPTVPSALVASLFFIVPAWGALLVKHGPELGLHASKWFGRVSHGAVLLLVSRAFRLALVLVFALITLTAIVFTIGLLAGYAEATRLSQQLQLDGVGAVSVFLLHIAYLPTLLIWTLSWCVGPGFAIGTGSSVTSFEVLLGPIPALPVFGLIPDALGQWGILTILLVVIVAFTVGYVVGGRPEYRNPGMLMTVGAGAMAALMVGLTGALFGWLATGPVGPGRLSDVGPPVLWFAAMLAAETLVGVVGGLLARRVDTARFIRNVERGHMVEREVAPALLQDETPPVANLSERGDVWFRDEDPRPDRLRPFESLGNGRLSTDTEESVAPDTESRGGEMKSTSRFPLARSKRKERRDAGPSFEEEDLLEEYSWDPQALGEQDSQDP